MRPVQGEWGLGVCSSQKFGLRHPRSCPPAPPDQPQRIGHTRRQPAPRGMPPRPTICARSEHRRHHARKVMGRAKSNASCRNCLPRPSAPTRVKDTTTHNRVTQPKKRHPLRDVIPALSHMRPIAQTVGWVQPSDSASGGGCHKARTRLGCKRRRSTSPSAGLPQRRGQHDSPSAFPASSSALKNCAAPAMTTTEKRAFEHVARCRAECRTHQTIITE